MIKEWTNYWCWDVWGRSPLGWWIQVSPHSLPTPVIKQYSRRQTCFWKLWSVPFPYHSFQSLFCVETPNKTRRRKKSLNSSSTCCEETAEQGRNLMGLNMFPLIFLSLKVKGSSWVGIRRGWPGRVPSRVAAPTERLKAEATPWRPQGWRTSTPAESEEIPLSNSDSLQGNLKNFHVNKDARAHQIYKMKTLIISEEPRSGRSIETFKTLLLRDKTLIESLTINSIISEFELAA